jgi:hypothetical protein
MADGSAQRRRRILSIPEKTSMIAITDYEKTLPKQLLRNFMITVLLER